MSWTEEQIQNTVKAVMDKAASDTEFRALAVSDIYAAIQQETGLEVPREFKINAVDGSGYHSTIVLPAVRGEVDELTETELESVAGGSKVAPNPNQGCFYYPREIGAEDIRFSPPIQIVNDAV